MSSKCDLKLDWCSYAAAKYAVEHWHYSKTMPMPPWNCIGVWEDRRFVGVIVFGRGASPNLGMPYGLSNIQVCELLRVGLTDHACPVTQMVAIALRMCKKGNPGLRLIVSFADTNEGHHGGIYQAGNWFYLGMTAPSTFFRDARGKVWHPRGATATGWRTWSNHDKRSSKCAKISECEKVKLPGKHRYAMPFDAEMRRQIKPLSQPYPKRVGSVDSDTPALPGGKGRCDSDPDALSVQ